MMASPEKVIGVIPGQPMAADTESHAAPSAHGAVAPKPTSVFRVEPQGVPVNPNFTHGNPVPNDYPYRADQTEWAVESGSHA